MSGRPSVSSTITPPIGTSSNGSGLPGPDFGAGGGQQQQQLFIVEEEPFGRQRPLSLGSRLSQQALSEIRDRWGVVLVGLPASLLGLDVRHRLGWVIAHKEPGVASGCSRCSALTP